MLILLLLAVAVADVGGSASGIEVGTDRGEEAVAGGRSAGDDTGTATCVAGAGARGVDGGADTASARGVVESEGDVDPSNPNNLSVAGALDSRSKGADGDTAAAGADGCDTDPFVSALLLVLSLFVTVKVASLSVSSRSVVFVGETVGFNESPANKSEDIVFEATLFGSMSHSFINRCGCCYSSWFLF